MAKPYKSPISYPYMEKLYIYGEVTIVALITDATDPNKIYFVAATNKLYVKGALGGVDIDKLAPSNMNYRFLAINNISSSTITFSANTNYLLTGNTILGTTVFTTTTALNGTESMDYLYLGNTLLDVQNGSIIYNTFEKILKLKDGLYWSSVSYYLILPTDDTS